MKTSRMLAAAIATVCFSSIVFAGPASGEYFLTQSERVLCVVTPDKTMGSADGDWAVCQGGFTQAPNGENCVSTSGNGSFHWASANAAFDMPRTKMSYGHTYQWGNWSLAHGSTGTKVTNTRTGHGMFVSIDNVYAF